MSTISERLRASGRATKTREDIFAEWSKPPGKTEQERCENAVKAIRNAVAKSEKLNRRDLLVFPQGSYRNRVNVKRESDVDVGVVMFDTFSADYPEGKTRADYNNLPATYPYAEFKNDLEAALVAHFGRDAVRRGNKAFDIRENSYHVEADVVPFIEYRRYFPGGLQRRGVALYPDRGRRVLNYPERLRPDWPHDRLHYENGVTKNQATGRAYKGVVRILKNLRNRMADAGRSSAEPIPGFLLECMAWNVSDRAFAGATWDDRVQAVLANLWTQTKPDGEGGGWFEVNAIKYLFHSSQPWTREQAHRFIDDAWTYVGVRP